MWKEWEREREREKKQKRKEKKEREEGRTREEKQKKVLNDYRRPGVGHVTPLTRPWVIQCALRVVLLEARAGREAAISCGFSNC